VLVVARLPCEEVRANDLTRARRQHGACGEPDGGGAKRARKGGVPQRLEQVLPAEGPNRQVHDHRCEREHQPLRPRMGDGGHDTPQIDVVQKQGDQRNGDRQHDERAEMGTHST